RLGGQRRTLARRRTHRRRPHRSHPQGHAQQAAAQRRADLAREPLAVLLRGRVADARGPRPRHEAGLGRCHGRDRRGRRRVPVRRRLQQGLRRGLRRRTPLRALAHPTPGAIHRPAAGARAAPVRRVRHERATRHDGPVPAVLDRAVGGRLVAWVYLDDQFPDHPKVALAGGDAGCLFICALAYAKRHATEGVIPTAQVPRLSDRKAPTKLARRLVEVGLWEEDGDTYRIHDYHEWNRPGENRKAAARKAAQARWRNSQGNAKRNAKRNASASETHSESDSDPPAERTADASETHSDRIRDAHASTCPLPLPLTEDLTSSNGLTTRPDTPDDDDPATAPPNGHNPQPHQPNHAPDQDQ